MVIQRPSVVSFIQAPTEVFCPPSVKGGVCTATSALVQRFLCPKPFSCVSVTASLV